MEKRVAFGVEEFDKLLKNKLRYNKYIYFSNINLNDLISGEIVYIKDYAFILSDIGYPMIYNIMDKNGY